MKVATKIVDIENHNSYELTIITSGEKIETFVTKGLKSVKKNSKIINPIE